MKNRIIYFDYLRVFAIIAVIILHVSAYNWYEVPSRSFEWNIFNFFNGIVRFGVPIFIMISGSLFLTKELDLKKLYSKNILRMTIAYFFWSIVYAITIPLSKSIITGNFEISIMKILDNIITGNYHMWFIPMIIGLYMCIPIIKEITKSKKITKYYLLLSLIFAFGVPWLVNISNDFIGGVFASIINKFNEVITNNMSIHLVLGFTFYFILGYYLNNIELTKKQRKIIFILGLIGFITTIGLNALVAWRTNEPCETYYSNFSINVLVEAIAIHTWFKYKEYKFNKFNTIISKLSKYSFGAYLVHALIIDAINIIGLNTLIFSPIASIPIISLVTIVLSFTTSWIINKIPLINKWIV